MRGEVELRSSDINETVLTSGLDLLFKNWIDHWVNFVFNSFDNQTFSFLHTEFQKVVFEFRIGQLHDASCWVNMFGVFILNPILSLSLRVDQQWIS
jgi:hypothetical protein